jgi:hypothetical protein
MRTLKLLSTASIAIALSATVQAQFSVSGGGDSVPSTGLGGGMWSTGMPVAPGTSTATVLENVTMISSVVIEGFSHDWGGDVHATLSDPNGIEYNLFLRPGFMNPSGADFGTPGDFLSGDYTIVESGGSDLPTVSDGVDITPGTYNQTFNTGGVTWTDGENGIFNVALGSISGPMGIWELNIYDWGVGDSGSFTGWTLNGNQGASENTGNPLCDGSGGNCPCGATGAADQGCPNTNPNGNGAKLSGSGHAQVAADTFNLTISDGPFSKPGLVLQGTIDMSPGISGINDSEGLLCVGGSTQRGDVFLTDANGDGDSGGVFQNGGPYGDAANLGGSNYYQFWFRDPQSACNANNTGASNFNFTNSWTVTWIP